MATEQSHIAICCAKFEKNEIICVTNGHRSDATWRKNELQTSKTNH